MRSSQLKNKFSRFLNQLKNQYDVIILNSPDFFRDDNAVILSQFSDLVLIVTNAFKTRLDEVNDIVGNLRLNDVHQIYGIINGAEDHMRHNHFNVVSNANSNVVVLDKGA
jgi:Mrp family chromosome partitioning ATPase